MKPKHFDENGRFKKMVDLIIKNKIVFLVKYIKLTFSTTVTMA